MVCHDAGTERVEERLEASLAPLLLTASKRPGTQLQGPTVSLP